VVEALGEDPEEPLITIHGDFHEVQVLVDPGGVCGLLDLDDVGPGQRLDDLAMMVGRFWSFAPFERRGQERIAQYALDLLETFGRFADPDELHVRVACILLARATSPFRSQSPRWRRDSLRAIELAERWLDRSGTGIATALSV
jgi:Ser/Thr protein kinase RdoA (MazF antagonist)